MESRAQGTDLASEPVIGQETLFQVDGELSARFSVGKKSTTLPARGCMPAH